MAYPVIESSSQEVQESEVTSINIGMPTGVSEGDLLILFFAWGNHNTNPVLPGWTLMSKTNGADQNAGGCWYKVAGASESTLNVTYSGGNVSRATGVIVRISGGDGSTNVPESTSTLAVSSSADPPSETASWGSDENLFFAFAAMSYGGQSFTGTPSSYTSVTQITTSAAPEVYVMYRNNTSASDDPSSFSLSGGVGWTAHTAVISPAAAAGPANLKTKNTVVTASIKTIGGTVIANVKSVNTIV